MGHNTIGRYIEQLKDLDLLDEIGDCLILKVKGLIIDQPKDKQVKKLIAMFDHMIDFNEGNNKPLSRECMIYKKYKEKGLSDNDAAYAGLIEGMDKSLGDLMDYLEKNDLMDNTIILFMSDNGGLASEPYWHTPLYVQNAPLSSGKGSAHEGGIREPMMVYWPGVTQPHL